MKQTPKVAAVHDLSGFGRCSLMVALPVLAAMGNQCCPLPTAYLSAHTACPCQDRAVFLDMTGQMEGAMEHWAALQVEFDVVYSGFLGSPAQIEVLLRFLSRFRAERTLVVVDPVMGDHGRRYRTYTPEMCRRMGELAARADLITPNLTEAALLLGEDYAAAPKSEREARAWLERLSLGGRRSAVLTGLSLAPGAVGAGCYDRDTGRTSFSMTRAEPGQYPGTGDLFASVVLGCMLRGESLSAAVGRAVEFVQKCVRRTLLLGTPVVEGVQFEPLLGELLARA